MLSYDQQVQADILRTLGEHNLLVGKLVAELAEINNAIQEYTAREMGAHTGGRESPGRKSKGR